MFADFARHAARITTPIQTDAYDTPSLIESASCQDIE